MKFIRDIISEKSRLSAERAASMAPAEPQSSQPLYGQQPATPEPDWDSIETMPSMPDSIQTPPETTRQTEDAITLGAVGSDLTEAPDTSDEHLNMSATSEDDPDTATDEPSIPDGDAPDFTSMDMDDPDPADTTGFDDPDPDRIGFDASDPDTIEIHTDEDSEAAEQDVALPVLRLDASDLSEPPQSQTQTEPELTDAQTPVAADDAGDVPSVDDTMAGASDEGANAEMNIFMPSSDAEEEDSYLEPSTESAAHKLRRIRDAQVQSQNPEPINEATLPPTASGLAAAQPERPPFPSPDQAMAEQAPAAPVSVPAPAVGRGAARAGRVKTRLLGFNSGPGAASDPFDKAAQQKSGEFTQFPVGWLVVVGGHGRGSAFTLFDGVSLIGRGTDQTVCLDFGDNSISRTSHAVIAYDGETRKFFLGHGGKTNLVRLNNRPVLSTEEMGSGDLVRIGETTLRFVGLCGNDFQWHDDSGEVRQNASFS